jgi:hypothetical protein
MPAAVLGRAVAAQLAVAALGQQVDDAALGAAAGRGEGASVQTPRLRYWRDYRALTLHEVAAKAGVAYRTVWRLEHGF